jgi:YegS/Rv2252/BmrU family lipid kinase
VTRSFALLVNPRSAGGRPLKVLPTVRAELDRDGAPYRVVETRSLEHAREEARAAADAGETVATLGGDGFVGPIAGELRHRDTALAVLPGGRGNDFARVLGIPREIPGAVALLAHGTPRAIDVGEVNGSRFLGIASCGYDSECNEIANRTRLVRGNLVYLYSALRALAAWTPARFTLVLDGERREFVGYSAAAANSRAYGGGMFLAPDAELDDGRLDVVCIAQVGKLHFLANLPKVFRGRHTGNEEVTVVRAREVEISADRDFAVYADGDHLADLPARIHLLPRALTVIAPP